MPSEHGGVSGHPSGIPQSECSLLDQGPGGKPGGGGKSWPAGVALKGLNPPGMGWRKKEAS